MADSDTELVAVELSPKLVAADLPGQEALKRLAQGQLVGCRHLQQLVEGLEPCSLKLMIDTLFNLKF